MLQTISHKSHDIYITADAYTLLLGRDNGDALLRDDEKSLWKLIAQQPQLSQWPLARRTPSEIHIMIIRSPAALRSLDTLLLLPCPHKPLQIPRLEKAPHYCDFSTQ
jgi:hypothetical protein